MNKYLYIFIDESGNFDFSPSGTKHFVLTGVSTVKPLSKRKKFTELRYSILCQGQDQELFHATEDKQHIRNSVFDLIEIEISDIVVDSVVAQKNKTHSSLYQVPIYNKDGTIKQYKNEPDEFYRIICQTLLKYIFMRGKRFTISGVVVVLSSLFTKKRCKLITKTLKSYLKNYTNYPFYIYFHRSESDINSQIADYCGWAVFVKHERLEKRPYIKIKSKLKSEFDIFRRGTTVQYQYK